MIEFIGLVIAVLVVVIISAGLETSIANFEDDPSKWDEDDLF